MHPETNRSVVPPRGVLRHWLSISLSVAMAMSLSCTHPDGEDLDAEIAEALTTCPCSIWSGSAVPAAPSVRDSNAVELGLKFRSDVDGKVTAVRFYKGGGNSGTHVGNLWSSSGTKLASVVFTQETSSGWQRAEFAKPVSITASTTYVVSYFAPAGHYAADNNAFASTGVRRGPLRALRSGVDGSNGVYRYGSSSRFPDQSWMASNYWVDVVFMAQGTALDTLPPSAPGNFAAASGASNSMDLSWTAGTDNVGVTGYVLSRGGEEIAVLGAAASHHQDTGLAPFTSYSYSLVARDAAGNSSPAATVSGMTRSGACVPDCSDKVCGSDSCGGTCGTCGAGQACGTTGQCTSTPPTTLPGWKVDASNTGLAPHGLSCDSLPLYTGPLKPARGARIHQVQIAGNLDLSNGDIEIDKSCIRPPSGNNRALISNDVCGSDECSVTSPGTVTVRDSEIDGSIAPLSSLLGTCAFRGVGTLKRNYIHGMDSGICFFGTGFQHSGLAEQNYVTGLRHNPGAHREAATVRDFRITQNPSRTIKFINNRLDCSGDGVTGGLFIQPTWVDIHNVTIEGNYLEGAGYNLYLENKGGVYGNIRAMNNRFRSTGWGPSVVSSGVGYAQWVDNYRYDPTKGDGKGSVVSP